MSPTCSFLHNSSCWKTKKRCWFSLMFLLMLMIRSLRLSKSCWKRTTHSNSWEILYEWCLLFFETVCRVYFSFILQVFRFWRITIIVPICVASRKNNFNENCFYLKKVTVIDFLFVPSVSLRIPRKKFDQNIFCCLEKYECWWHSCTPKSTLFWEVGDNRVLSKVFLDQE